VSSEPPEILLAGYRYCRDIGNAILIGGLIAEVAVIAIVSEKRKYKWLLEFLAALVVLVGVWIEVQYGGYVDDVEFEIQADLKTKLIQVAPRAELLYGKAENILSPR